MQWEGREKGSLRVSRGLALLQNRTGSLALEVVSVVRQKLGIFLCGWKIRAAASLTRSGAGEQLGSGNSQWPRRYLPDVSFWQSAIGASLHTVGHFVLIVRHRVSFTAKVVPVTYQASL